MIFKCLVYSCLLLFLTYASKTQGQTSVDTWNFNIENDAFTDDAVLDLRYLNEDVAGQNGYITLSDDGESFKTEKGNPIRFWAIGGGELSRKLDNDDLQKFARFLSKKGVNMIRFHGKIHSVTDDMYQANTDELDAIWKMVATMKSEGIYSTISPFWSHFIKKIPEGWPLEDYAGTDKLTYALLYFNENFKNAYKSWLTQLYTQTNPYTGIPLKDDKSIAIIQILNEDGVFFWTIDKVLPSLRTEIRKQFYTWLLAKYGAIENAYNAWLKLPPLKDDNPGSFMMDLYPIWETTIGQTGGKDLRLSDQMAFFHDKQSQFYSEIYNHLRSIGCKQLINASNWKTANNDRLLDLERASNSVADVLAVNRYYSPEHMGEYTGWRVQPGDKYVGASLLYNPHKLPVNVKQVDGKPFIMSESSWPLPHKYLAESVFLTTAYASLTGFDAYYWYGPRSTSYSEGSELFYTHDDNFKIDYQPVFKFNISIPGYLSAFPANALLYRLGYVKEGATIVDENRSFKDLYKRIIPVISEDSGFDPNRDDEVNNVESSKTKLTPLTYLTGKVKVTYGSNDESLISQKIDSLINYEDKTVLSSTNELSWNYGEGICTLNTPYAQGVSGFFNDTNNSIQLKDVTLNVGNDYATMLLVSMDEKPIKSSKKLLLQVNTTYQLTNYLETPTTFIPKGNDEAISGFEIIKTGRLPWQAKNTLLTLQINNGIINTAHLLNENGYVVESYKITDNKNIKVPTNTLYLILDSD